MACGRHLSQCGAVLLCTALLWHGAAGSELLQRLSRAHFDFTLSMFSTLVNITDDRQQNLLISPYSVFSLVSMLFLGAGSESLSSAQLRAVLRFHNISYAGAQRAFQEVTHVLDDPYYRRSFREAAGLLLSSEVEPAAMYTRAVRQFYGRAVSRLDFADPAAADDVAAWLRGAANVSVGADAAGVADGRRWSALDVALSDSPVLLLTSQAHFHGRWLRPFDLKRTFSKGLFFSEPSKRLEVPMMTGRFVLPLGYSADMESRVLELPLRTRRISIFLLLPDDMERGLARLEANLTMDNLRTLLATLKEAIVNVKLPRFRLESSGDLRTVLMTQGLTDVFDPNSADLTGIDPEGRVHPSNLFYTASVVVDESGDGGDTSRVEQVAPPTDQVAPSSDPRLTDKYFEVDHPFVFLVWDYHSAMVLLMGRVVHPDPIY